MFQVSHFEDNNRNKTLIYINNENWLSGDIELVICDSFSAGMIISWYCEIRKRTHFRKATQFALVEKLAMVQLACSQILQKEKTQMHAFSDKNLSVEGIASKEWGKNVIYHQDP